MAGCALAFPAADKPAPDYKPAPAPQYKPAPAPQYKAAPAPYAPPKPHYAPAPYKEEKHDPQPYAFEYGVTDEYTGSNFKAAESQDDAGTVLGSYTVNLPDGRIQTVSYKADHYGGFVADVKYEGTPVYPPEPAEGYGNTYKAAPKYHKPAPKYAPAPPPKYEA